MLQRLVEDGTLKGRVRIERNTIPEYGGTHAWASFISPDGNEYVIDAAQDYVGTKKEAQTRNKSWDYYLPVV